MSVCPGLCRRECFVDNELVEVSVGIRSHKFDDGEESLAGDAPDPVESECSVPVGSVGPKPVE